MTDPGPCIHHPVVGPGDLVHIPAGCPQRIANLGDTDLTFLALCTPRFTHTAYGDLDPDPS
jgi:mannose-6-phosphate isomerase-like protein (cupin superfamily)